MALQLFKIETVDVATATTTVTFSNIPQTYTHLILKNSLRATSATSGGFINLNGSSSGYAEKILYGDGTTASGANISLAGFVWAHLTALSTSTADTFGSMELLIPNYTSSNYKSICSNSFQENNGVASVIYSEVGIWSNTAAVTSIAITSGSSFAVNSSFSLYGVL